MRIDGQDAFNRYALGRALTLLRRHDAAILELDKAIELEPSFAQAHYALGMALGTGGRPQEALPHIELAMRSARRTRISGSSWCDALRHISSWDGWRRRSSRPSGRCTNQTSSGLVGRFWPPHRRTLGGWRTHAAVSEPCTRFVLTSILHSPATIGRSQTPTRYNTWWTAFELPGCPDHRKSAFGAKRSSVNVLFPVPAGRTGTGR